MLFGVMFFYGLTIPQEILFFRDFLTQGKVFVTRSNFLSIQSVSVAVEIQKSPSPQLQSGLGIALRIEFHHLNPVCGHKSEKRNIVLLRHGVLRSNELLILHSFNLQSVVFIDILRLQSRKGHPAAADQRLSAAMNNIPAYGTNVKL